MLPGGNGCLICAAVGMGGRVLLMQLLVQHQLLVVGGCGVGALLRLLLLRRQCVEALVGHATLRTPGFFHEYESGRTRQSAAVPHLWHDISAAYLGHLSHLF